MYLIGARGCSHRVSQMGTKKILECRQVLFLLAAAVGNLWLNAHWKDNVQSISGAGGLVKNDAC